MNRPARIICLLLGVSLLLQMALLNHLWAFSITETRIFKEGPYHFKMEIQVNGRGDHKKKPLKITSLKVKIKNDWASSETMRVKSIRVRLNPEAYQDIDTRGYSIPPGKWVTKYYRLAKEKQPSLGERGSIEIAFDQFTLFFNPRERKFQGPRK